MAAAARPRRRAAKSSRTFPFLSSLPRVRPKPQTTDSCIAAARRLEESKTVSTAARSRASLKSASARTAEPMQIHSLLRIRIGTLSSAVLAQGSYQFEGTRTHFKLLRCGTHPHLSPCGTHCIGPICARHSHVPRGARARRDDDRDGAQPVRQAPWHCSPPLREPARGPHW